MAAVQGMLEENGQQQQQQMEEDLEWNGEEDAAKQNSCHIFSSSVENSQNKVS